MTKIQWCAKPGYVPTSWNPVTGCSPISEGCQNCYAQRYLKRGLFPYGPEVTLHPERLDIPLRWRKPRFIFVCSMGDLFHRNIPDDFIFSVLKVVRDCPQHIFVFLTKRAERMRMFYVNHINIERVLRSVGGDEFRWPLRNLWLGVTAENQRTADERIPILLRIPAAVRFVSVEPMLGSVVLCNWCKTQNPQLDGRKSGRYRFHPEFGGYGEACQMNGIDWVICGGESGPGARPMHPSWARSLRDQCKAAGVPFFFKAWGEWISEDHAQGLWPEKANGDPKPNAREIHAWPDGGSSIRHGKKAAGRLLDGMEHNEYPK